MQVISILFYRKELPDVLEGVTSKTFPEGKPPDPCFYF